MTPINLTPGHVIWKHNLGLHAIQAAIMPRGSEIIHVACQNGGIVMWFACDPEETTVERWYAIVGTGYRFPAGLLRYVGSVQQISVDTPDVWRREYVWHVFECEAP